MAQGHKPSGLASQHVDHTPGVGVHMPGHSVGYHDHVHPYQVPGGVEGDHNSRHCSHDNLLVDHLNEGKRCHCDVLILHKCFRFEWIVTIIWRVVSKKGRLSLAFVGISVGI